MFEILLKDIKIEKKAINHHPTEIDHNKKNSIDISWRLLKDDDIQISNNIEKTSQNILDLFNSCQLNSKITLIETERDENWIYFRLDDLILLKIKINNNNENENIGIKVDGEKMKVGVHVAVSRIRAIIEKGSLTNTGILNISDKSSAKVATVEFTLISREIQQIENLEKQNENYHSDVIIEEYEYDDDGDDDDECSGFWHLSSDWEEPPEYYNEWVKNEIENINDDEFFEYWKNIGIKEDEINNRNLETPRSGKEVYDEYIKQMFQKIKSETHEKKHKEKWEIMNDSSELKEKK